MSRIAEREGRNKNGNLENSIQNTLHIQHRESNKYCHSVVLWVCLVDKSGPAMAGPAGAAPTPLLHHIFSHLTPPSFLILYPYPPRRSFSPSPSRSYRSPVHRRKQSYAYSPILRRYVGMNLCGYVCWCVHVYGHVVSLVASPLCLGGGLILTLLFQGIRVLVLIVLCIRRSMGPGLLCIAEEKDGGRKNLIPHHYHPAGTIDINLFLFSRR